MIAFVGSVFSPFYFRSRLHNEAVPAEAHCAINVALYMPGRKRRWIFSEWPRCDVERSEDALTIGFSRLCWRGGRLEIAVSDLCPRQKRLLRGRIVFEPSCRFGEPFCLDGMGRHFWWPISPGGRFEANFKEPEARFSGSGYHDVNHGDEPLEKGLAQWQWSRFPTEDGTLVVFDGLRKDGVALELAKMFSADGRVHAPPDLALRKLPRTFLWAFPRATRCQTGQRPRVLRTLEESPFYARSLVKTIISDRPVVGVHESLSLERFCAPWMQKMLPYRIAQRRR